ncbi:PEP-CTERM sorting domain-containing protein [Alkalimonas delamerensis]|uniref:PEP-CTERM sorting domain-containing protein n=1 Tax=Alkalimonas delamerensis TaxID=265981 RepID=A0ABT9GN75_9GAMM|nr:PEP-CTERM sorting domain-containing protein [Alkalimonas delamerensis]MDP4528418.1 PEP-CTERM sorting domain-containing protein [Alkalimonas delamerensis]
MELSTALKTGLTASGAALALFFASQSVAAPIIMEGDFVKTAISENGTLGYGGTIAPGLLHDPTGNRNFGVNDYLTPGDPWEWFGVTVAGTTYGNNNNNTWSGGSFGFGTLNDVSGTSSYDHHVSWSSALSGLLSIEHQYYFNDGDERVNITTTITALDILADVKFLRAIDPDPDVNTHGTYDTINGRGYGALAPEDWVHSLGANTGFALGIYSNSSVTHNTGVSAGWTTNPDFYLNGNDDGTGDFVIGMAFLLGDMTQGQSISFDYAYVMGDSIDNVDIPPSNPVPAPASLALLALGLVGIRFSRRRN